MKSLKKRLCGLVLLSVLFLPVSAQQSSRDEYVQIPKAQWEQLKANLQELSENNKQLQTQLEQAQKSSNEALKEQNQLLSYNQQQLQQLELINQSLTNATISLQASKQETELKYLKIGIASVCVGVVVGGIAGIILKGK